MNFIVEFMINWMMLTVYFTLVNSFVTTMSVSPNELYIKIFSGLVLLFIMSPYTKYYTNKILNKDE